MNLTDFPPPYGGQPPEAPHADIVVVYDSFASGIRGKGFCDQLVEKLGVRTELHESLWRSDLLAGAGIRREVAAAALGADFVVLSLRGDGELSEAFESWCGEWMPRARGRDITLVVLFDPATVRRLAMESVRCYLRKAAFAAGVHFFAHTVAQNGNGAGAPADRSLVIGEPVIDTETLAASIPAPARFTRGQAAMILVVDDNESLCEMVARHLHAAGHGTLRAHDGEEARRIVAASEHRIDLVVSDIEMPRMRGDEFAVWLRQEHPETPVLLMSTTRPKDGYDFPYLAKPFRAEVLVETVGKLLDPLHGYGLC